MTGSGAGTWKVDADGRLMEMVVFADVDGAPVPAGVLSFKGVPGRMRQGVFRYDEAWRRRPGAKPLAATGLPLRRSFQSLPPHEIPLPLYDASPDGWGRLFRANLREADLRTADLSGAIVGQTNLSGADLSGANLSGAIVLQTNLSGAELRGANLIEANLTDANLTDANLTDANLSGAKQFKRDPKDPDFREAKPNEANLTEAKLGGAKLCRTVLPDGQVSDRDCPKAND